MPTNVIIAVVIVFILSAAIAMIMQNMSKKVGRKYNGPDAFQIAPQIQQELISTHFHLLKKQMQNAPIDAFTQCMYITTVGSKVKSVAVTVAKTLAWAAVGVKARYNEADNVAYLLLSGDELHYIFFEEGEAKEHLIFDRYRLLNAKAAPVSNTDKVTRMVSVMGQKPFKIVITINGRDTDIMFYSTVQRMPDGGIMPGRGMMDVQARFGLMGRYFKKKLYQKYPHLFE